MEEKIYFDNKLSYSERMAQREVVEKNLWDRISAVIPWQIKISSPDQDMIGIDATFDTLKDGRSVPNQTVQLKMRESGGDDILIEMIRPWEGMTTINNLKWNGRNSKIEIDKYFFVDTNNILRIIDGRYLTKIGKDMALKFVEAYKRDNSIRSLRVYNGDIKILLEPSAEASFTMGKVEKLAVFIIPSKIKINYKINIG